MAKSDNGGTIIWRVTQLEKQTEEISDKISLVLENHLPHLATDMMSLKTRINVLTAINIGAVIMGLIIARIFN